MEISGTIIVSAQSVQQGQAKITAAVKIIKALPYEDLLYLADIAQKKPDFVKKAKPYVNML